MADPFRDAIAAVVRELAPANDPPRWRRIESEASRRGFPSTRSFRGWCLSHGVVLREDNQRDTWVDPAAVDAAVEKMPAVSARRREGDSDLDGEIDRSMSTRSRPR